jgi:hypothetical protein
MTSHLREYSEAEIRQKIETSFKRAQDEIDREKNREDVEINEDNPLRVKLIL